MADYKIDPNDTRIHTRYSELIRCTPGQIQKVLQERFEGRRRVETVSMRDGTIRHEMWQEEAEKTARVPKIFGLDWPVSHVEHEFASEILPGIVVHSRPDIVCAEKFIVPDFKTVLDGANGWRKNLEQYKHRSKQRQLRFYAWQVGLQGFRIKKGAFLCEIWNSDRSEIIGHEVVEFDITLQEMMEELSWVKQRCNVLAAALESYARVRA